jgi:hypothetical protein
MGGVEVELQAFHKLYRALKRDNRCSKWITEALKQVLEQEHGGFGGGTPWLCSVEWAQIRAVA